MELTTSFLRFGLLFHKRVAGFVSVVRQIENLYLLRTPSIDM